MLYISTSHYYHLLQLHYIIIRVCFQSQCTMYTLNLPSSESKSESEEPPTDLAHEHSQGK